MLFYTCGNRLMFVLSISLFQEMYVITAEYIGLLSGYVLLLDIALKSHV